MIGIFNTGSDVSFSRTLTFTKGTTPAAPSRIHMGSKKLIEISPNASVSGPSANNGWVNGTYQRAIAAGAITANFSFPIGNATVYTPFVLPAGTVSSAGDIWAKTVDGDDPNLSSSQLIATKSVNRYWVVDGTAAFSTAQVRPIYVAGDNDAGTTPTNYKIGLYSGGAWTYPAIGTPAPDNTTIYSTNSLTNIYGEYAVAERCTMVTISSQPVAQAVCENATLTLSVTAANATSYQWYGPSGLISGANSATYTKSGVALANAGNYYVIALGSAPGCNLQSNTVAITVTPQPVGTFAYTGTPYCKTTNSATPTGAGLTAGGTYSVPAGLTLVNATTGEINPSTSTPGTYTVNYDIAAAGGCNAFNTTATVVINAAPNATILYTGGPYCNDGGTATVTHTGTTGGTYSASPAGLSINGTTGTITLNTSSAGTYAVNYIIAPSGGCSGFFATTNITINPKPAGTFAYTGTPYCKTTNSATPTGAGLTAGGTYSVPAGLTLVNATTGEINPSTSTPGTYTVNYDIAAAGGCNAFNTTASVTVENPVVSITPSNVSATCNAITAQIDVTVTGAVSPTLTWSTQQGLYTDAAATTAFNGSAVVSPLYAKLTNDMVYGVALSSGGCVGNSVQVNIGVGSATNALASSSSSIQSAIPAGASLDVHDASCKLIATIVPGGVSPVSGLIDAQVYVSGSVPVVTFAGVNRPYVQRYYQITPQSPAQQSGGTATLTLYATNAEFQAYNTYLTAQGNPMGLPMLPDASISPTQNTNNVRITKEAGTSQSGLPGSFTPGTPSVITPAVSWDAAANNGVGQWEITFAVTGFSGFFIGTGTTPLPVVFTAINATAEKGRNRVEWNVGAEDNVMSYEVEKDLNGSFTTIGKLPAAGEAQYVFYDEKPISGRNTYRVKSVDVDGRYGYSPTATVIVKGENGFTLELFPNPTKDVVIVRSSGTTATEATVIVSELSGRMILRRTIRANEDQLDLSVLPAGTYMLQWNDGVHKESIRVTRQ